MRTVTATIAISGKLDRFNVLTDEALEGMAERMRADDREHVLPFRTDAGELAVGTYDPTTVEVVELAPGLKAVRLEVEIPEGVELEAKPDVVRGLEQTEEERARVMRELEGNVKRQ